MDGMMILGHHWSDWTSYLPATNQVSPRAYRFPSHSNASPKYYPPSPLPWLQQPCPLPTFNPSSVLHWAVMPSRPDQTSQDTFLPTNSVPPFARGRRNVVELLLERETAFKDYRDKHRQLMDCRPNSKLKSSMRFLAPLARRLAS